MIRDILKVDRKLDKNIIRELLNIRESYEDWEFVIEFTREKNWGKTAQREACENHYLKVSV